jgi:hypothetical protein
MREQYGKDAEAKLPLFSRIKHKRSGFKTEILPEKKQADICIRLLIK